MVMELAGPVISWLPDEAELIKGRTKVNKKNNHNFQGVPYVEANSAKDKPLRHL